VIELLRREASLKPVVSMPFVHGRGIVWNKLERLFAFGLKV